MSSCSTQAMPARANRRHRVADREVDEAKCSFLVVGGGIAGVSAAQELSRLNPSSTITLLSQTKVLREVMFSNRLTEHLEELTVQESSADELKKKFPNIRVAIGQFKSLDIQAREVVLSDQSRLRYGKLCLCMGASPRVMWNHDNIITIRDTQSVENMSSLLQSAEKVMLLGNGGIALELAHELDYCEISWVVRDPYIGSPFFDATASGFLLEAEPRYNTEKEKIAEIAQASVEMGKKALIEASETRDAGSALGSAVGPHLRKKLAEIPHEHRDRPAPLSIYFERQVTALYDRVLDQWLPGLERATAAAAGAAVAGEEQEDERARMMSLLSVHNQSGASSHRFAVFIRSTQEGEEEETVLDCDFLVAALGVKPNSHGCEALQLDNEGSILVNETMQTSDPNIYAAGDCCNYQKSEIFATEGEVGEAGLNHCWIQMRLWAQARVMGLYAAQCINEGQYTLLPHNPSTRNDWAFEMFAHCTRLFGFKVVLLGRFNGQGLGKESEKVIKTVHVSESKLAESSARAQKKGKGQGEGEEEKESRGPVLDLSSRKRSRFGGGCLCCKDEPGGRLGCLLPSPGPESSKKGRSSSYNSSGSGSGLEVAIRYSPGQEYIKLVLVHGRVVGALLIGETDLEETFENLILNRIDVGHLGSQLLDPEHDLEDYFD